MRHFRAARALIGLVPQELTTDAFESVWATVSFSRGLFGKPANPALIEQILKDLLVLQGVHRPPEAFVLEGHQLVVLDQTLKRCLDQFLTRLDVIEHLLAHNEETAVDPHVGLLRWPQAKDVAGVVEVDHVQAERGPHGGDDA